MFGSFSRSKPRSASVSRQISTARSFVYVDSSGESRRMYAAWKDDGTGSRARRPSSRSNQRSRSAPYGVVDGAACAREDVGELAQRDRPSPPRFGARARDRRRRPASSSSPARRSSSRSLVERGGGVGLQPAQLLALAVVGEHRELRLGGAKRQLLALERHRGRQHRVLERVGLALGELGRDDPAFARLAQAVQALALVAVGRVRFGLAQRVELVAREEVGVARDDLRLLGGLLLAHADGARLPPSARERTGGDAIRTPRACGPPQQPYAESIRWRVPA